jgi:hypothetical protein
MVQQQVSWRVEGPVRSIGRFYCPAFLYFMGCRTYIRGQYASIDTYRENFLKNGL